MSNLKWIRLLFSVTVVGSLAFVITHLLDRIQPLDKLNVPNTHVLLDSSSSKNLFIFIHISDLHLSEYQDPNRWKLLDKFLHTVVPTVKPRVLLITGDLTDAKTSDNYGSQQNIWEWQKYQQLFNKNSLHYDFDIELIDIRGNHDNFDVPNRQHQHNYYNKYGLKSIQRKFSYGDEAVSFIPVDACPDPGLRRPFNFFGLLNQTQLDWIGKETESAKETKIVYYGHYPTSVIITDGQGNYFVKRILNYTNFSSCVQI